MYTLKDIYPNLYHTSTAETSIPERSEQATLQQIDTKDVAPYAVDAKQKFNFIGLVILIIAVLILMSV